MTGPITIPVKIDGPKIVVPVTFKNGNSSTTGYLAVDTGAAQTMVSKRIARDLRLLSMGSQKESESAVLSTWMSAWSRPSEWAELK